MKDDCRQHAFGVPGEAGRSNKLLRQAHSHVLALFTVTSTVAGSLHAHGHTVCTIAVTVGGGGGGGAGIAVSVQEPLQRFALSRDRHSNLSTANLFILIILKKNNLSVSCVSVCSELSSA